MIELRNINFRYAGGSDAGGLVNIDLIIPDGQVILLCGQSGCGKTTLTRLVNGLIPNYYEGELSGEVLLDGKNISRLPLYETAKYVGSVFQNPRTQFFTVDSTSELAFGCENQGLPEEEIIQRVKSTAEQFDMENLLGKNIFSLSGGEKQKIACASVSASNPPIIVLDEPSSNLDMSATKDLRRMIQIWKQQGKTVIIAEHRFYYLKELIDRVIYLKNGKIEKDHLASDALKLSAAQQAEMGLRPFDLGAFPVVAHSAVSCGTIECENFHFAYTKQRNALDIDSLSLPQAGIIAVIGHNGAGKSTLARTILRLYEPTSGTVTARVRLAYTGQQAFTQQRPVLTGACAERRTLTLLGRSWQLPESGALPEDVPPRVRWLPLRLGRLALPGCVQETTCWARETQEQTFTPKTAAALARRSARLQLLQDYPDAVVESERDLASTTATAAVCRAVFVFCANIAEPRSAPAASG